MRNISENIYGMKPIRFGIVGEYQSGKSLLVNCLLRRPVATVGSGIATTHTVVNYRYAEMEHVVYVDSEHERHAIPIERLYRLDTVSGIRVIDVYLANESLKGYILTDMPGFGANNEDNSVARQALQELDFAILVVSNDKSLGADSSAFKDIRMLWKYKIPYYFILNCRNMDRWRPDEDSNRNIARKDLALLAFHKPMGYPLEEDGINIVNFMWYWYSVREADDELLRGQEIRRGLADYEISEDVKEEVGKASNFGLIHKIFNMDNRAFLELRRDIKEEINHLRQELCPVGTIQSFAFIEVPEEWMCCDGRFLNRDEYADLFNVIGYTFGQKGKRFALPDLRGRFVRGWDNIGNRDGNREFGSLQDDALQEHGHAVEYCSSEGRHTHYVGFHNNLTKEANTFYTSYTHKDVCTYDDRLKSGNYFTDYEGDHQHRIAIGFPSDLPGLKVRVAAETRPKNVALMFCIKVR